jgi:hypothetical protein
LLPIDLSLFKWYNIKSRIGIMLTGFLSHPLVNKAAGFHPGVSLACLKSGKIKFHFGKSKKNNPWGSADKYINKGE